MAKTVHSQYGLRLAELPSQLLIERSLGQNVTVKQDADTTVLIWDEVSMSSTRIFEIVNKIHHMVSQNNLAFGGIQVILVGDFLQLKPIPSPSDEGKSIYLSELFDKVFPHRIELTEVLRQGEAESRLKNLLDMLRNGECSEEAEEYIHSLERECKCKMRKKCRYMYIFENLTWKFTTEMCYKLCPDFWKRSRVSTRGAHTTWRKLLLEHYL